MVRNRNTINLDDLPEDAKREIIDFYEFLKKKHSFSPEAPKDQPFDPGDFRGILHYPSGRVKQQLDQVRQEWDRHFE